MKTKKVQRSIFGSQVPKRKRGNGGNPARDSQVGQLHAGLFKTYFDEIQFERDYAAQRIVVSPAIGEEAAKNVYCGHLLEVYNRASHRSGVNKRGVGAVRFVGDKMTGEGIMIHIRALNGPVLTTESARQSLHGWLVDTWVLFHLGTAAAPNFSKYYLSCYSQYGPGLRQRDGRRTQLRLHTPTAKELYPSVGNRNSVPPTPDIYTAIVNAVNRKDILSMTILV
jgi:hypothetical protein